jgi:hypothetical protein
MNPDKVRSLLQGMAAINRILETETHGDQYFEAVTARFRDNLIMAGTGLSYAFNAEAETQDDMRAVQVEDDEDTRELPVVRIFNVNGIEVSR